MNLSDQIKDLITMDDVLDKYGFKKNRAGFITCPFHNEKTGSLKINKSNKSFKCYGCGIGGTVVDFVMGLFNISFTEALVKINDDFNLCLATKKTTLREREKHNEIIRQREKEKLLETKKRALYDEKCNEFKRLWNAKKNKAPKTTEEEWDEEFCEALSKLTELDFWFEINT